MFKKIIIKNLIKEEKGSVIILAAVLIVAVIGIVALVVDMGYLYLTRSNLQNAADAAAYAGAKQLPNQCTAVSYAVDYAGKNGVSSSNTIVNTPYNGDADKIEVICSENVSPSFATIFDKGNRTVSARAVAEIFYEWDGEASLPFLNLDDDYSLDPHIEAWEKTDPGDFESLWKDEYEMHNLGPFDDHSQGYFSVDYQDGIQITKGTVATIKQEVGYIYEQHRPQYIFSLSSSVIQSGKYNDVKNKDVIPLSDLVLLQVSFDYYDYQGKTLQLTYLDEYDINNGEYPTEYLNDISSVTSILTE